MINGIKHCWHAISFVSYVIFFKCPVYYVVDKLFGLVFEAKRTFNYIGYSPITIQNVYNHSKVVIIIVRKINIWPKLKKKLLYKLNNVYFFLAISVHLDKMKSYCLIHIPIPELCDIQGINVNQQQQNKINLNSHVSFCFLRFILLTPSENVTENPF